MQTPILQESNYKEEMQTIVEPYLVSIGTEFYLERHAGQKIHCGVTKDVVCVRKFRIEDPAGLKKMRFILDYHSIELFINDGQQTATTAICTPLNAKDIYFFSDKKMTMSVEKHDIIM